VPSAVHSPPPPDLGPAPSPFFFPPCVQPVPVTFLPFPSSLLTFVFLNQMMFFSPPSHDPPPISPLVKRTPPHLSNMSLALLILRMICQFALHGVLFPQRQPPSFPVAFPVPLKTPLFIGNGSLTKSPRLSAGFECFFFPMNFWVECVFTTSSSLLSRD